MKVCFKFFLTQQHHFVSCETFKGIQKKLTNLFIKVFREAGQHILFISIVQIKY